MALSLPLLLFLFRAGLVCTKVCRFVEYTPVNCHNNFVQSAVDARRQKDENPNYSVVAETMKLLAKRAWMAIKLRIAVNIQLPGTSMLKGHMQRTTKIWKFGRYQLSTLLGRLYQIWN